MNRLRISIVGLGYVGLPLAVALARSFRVTGYDISEARVGELRRGIDRTVTARYFLDGTELGDLLPMAKVEYVTGAESQRQTGEMHAAAEPQPAGSQSFTYCFAMD